MLIMGHPQFETQDDAGIGDGIASIPEWQNPALNGDLSWICGKDVDDAVRNVFIRLRNAFHRAERIPFPPTRLHDLTCFVAHRLLLSAPNADTTSSSPISECIRYAIIIYMLIIHGPTYYSHAVILNTMVTRFMVHLGRFESWPHEYDSLDTWLLAIGMVASTGSPHYQWFVERARVMASSLQLGTWNEALVRIKSVLWLETPQGEDVFRPHWDRILNAVNQPPLLALPQPSHLAIRPSLNDSRAGFL